MRISKQEITDFFNQYVRRADIARIKTLNQTQRKALMVMLRTLKRGEDSVESPLIAELTLETMKNSISMFIRRPPSPLIIRIVKALLNILNLRVSSRKLQREIVFVTTYGTREKYNLINKASFSTRQMINRLKISKQDMTDFILKMIKENNMAKEDGMIEQFINDYTRGGPVVTLSDPTKGMFQGKNLGKECSKNDHLHFHVEGLSKILDPEHEGKWLHLAQANITQTPFNAIERTLIPLIINEDGQQRTFKDTNYAYDQKITDTLANVEVVRHGNGEIKRLNIKCAILSKLNLKNEDTIPIGHLKSTISYSVSFKSDEKTPKLTNMHYKHTFSKQAFSKEKSVEPGFHPNQKKNAEEPESPVQKLIDLWKEELSKLKLSTKPTIEKIERLNRRIEDLEKTKNKFAEGPSLQKGETEQVISNFKQYLNELKK